MTIKPIIKKIIIIAVIAIALGVAYQYFFSVDKKPVGSLSSSMGASARSIDAIDAQIASDTAFLSTLLGLSNITIDPTLFSSKSFSSLKDNNVPIVDDGIVGRPNPFAPIDVVVEETIPTDGIVAASSPVSTLPATQITDTSAILSGSISKDIKAQSIYFEWGPIEMLGQKTTVATQSSVGTFSKSLAGLSPKTKYYFRAAALVGKTVIVGTTSSFTTN